MKVLQVHNFYRTRGGECSVVQSERNLLTEHNHEVSTYYRDSREIDQWGPIKKASMMLRVPYNRSVEQDLMDFLRRQRPDIAHVHNVFPLLTPSVYQALHKCGIPVVQTVHNFRLICPNGQFYVNDRICEDCQQYGYFSAVKKRCMQNNIIVSAAYSSALAKAWKSGIYPEGIDRYIVLNNFYAEKLIQAGVPRCKIHILDNFIQDMSSNSNNRKNYVLYLGRLSKEKGLMTLLEAWKNVDGAVLKIAGSGPLQKDIEKQIDNIGNTRVVYLGHVSGDAKQKLINEAICMVVPSEWYENFPISIVESLSCGTPVIASRIGGLPDLVKHERTGLLFEPANTGDLSKAINLFIKDEKFAARCSDNALKSAGERFGAEKHYQGLMEIYNKVINDNH